MKFISTKVHTIIGLVVGVVLIFASSIFNFTDNSAASMVAMWVGIFIVLNELITTSPSSPLKLVPMKVHLILDIVTGLFLAVSPWLFNFANSDEPSQWVPHLIVGIMVAGYALVTSTDDARENVRS
jgi:hypothetical protein